MARRANPHSRISPFEAERAIYIDGEGFQDQSPALFGILVGQELEQVVLDPDLAPVAEARGHRLSTLRREAIAIVDRANAEDRRVVAYSQHEREVFADFAGIDISEIYRDARMIGKRWRNRMYPELRGSSNDLKSFLELIGYERGLYLGDRKTTKRIRDVREMVSRKGSYDALTPVKKAQWTKLLQHNEIDCRGMQALVLRASHELQPH